MDKNAILADIRECLKAADIAEASDGDIPQDIAQKAMLGFALRHVAEAAAPYVAPAKVAIGILSNFRATAKP